MTDNPKEAAGARKLQLQLVPPAAKREAALALESGAQKYGEWNWRKTGGIKLMTYIGALQRHLDAIHAGEDIDPGSGVSHIGHILAGAAVVADAQEHGVLVDDRPKFVKATGELRMEKVTALEYGSKTYADALAEARTR